MGVIVVKPWEEGFNYMAKSSVLISFHIVEDRLGYLMRISFHILDYILKHKNYDMVE